MKTTRKLVVAALAVAGMALVGEALAQDKHGSRGSGAGPDTGRHWSGNRGGDGNRHWSGNRDGRHWSGHRHWRGGHRHYWGPSWGFYFGAPVLWGSYSWGAPYYYYDYPRSTVIYREVERMPEPLEPTTEVPLTEGAPTQGPLYMNYCESAKAYFPKVTTCPEGWRLATPTQ